ncbi:MAG: 30S ribosomal protein S10, partial [Candidatus Aenigmarchaeota archaeon]|nr:30S ribosomal protein S10 [Candidatus Aenigmarchaeota archaeon]
MQKARIKLMSTDIKKIEQVCNELKNISEKFGVIMRGPIPLPTKKLKVVTM